MMRRSPCMGSAAVLATVSSSNHVGRMDLTPIVAPEFCFTAEAMVHRRNHPGWDEDIDVAYIPCYIRPSLSEFGSDASYLTFYCFDVRFSSIERCGNLKTLVKLFESLNQYIVFR